MNDLELIFNMLGERVSTEITRKEDKQGFIEVEDDTICSLMQNLSYRINLFN